MGILNAPAETHPTEKSQSVLNEDQSFGSKSMAKDNGTEELLVFKDPSAAGQAVEACEEQSVKSRMKTLLAQRRTALQSRNLNIPVSSQNSDNIDRNGLKNRKTKTPSHTRKEIRNPPNGSSTLIEGSENKSHAVKQIDGFGAKNEVIEKSSNNQESNHFTESQTSLELDLSIASDIVDSSEVDSSTNSVENIGKLINKENTYDCGRNLKFSECHLETLSEESETKDSAEGENILCQSEDIEREQGELISFFEYCASINSKNSSEEKDDSDDSDNLSPNCYSVNDGSSLTPAASMQTFSVTSALTQKSQSSSPPSGITPTGSVQTFSVGGRSLTINSDPFKMSMFSPHFRSTDVYSTQDNGCDSDQSFGGNTVVPDISVRDESHVFPSPTHRMLYASPTAKVNLSQEKDNPDYSVQNLITELENQLEAIRSEREDSNQKISLSTKDAEIMLQLYAAVNKRKSKTSASYHNNAVDSPVSRILAVGDSSGLSRAAATSLIERNKTLVKEVRFADQTCVELSERNLSLIREKEKLDTDLKEMRAKNEKLHRDVLELSQDLARTQESKKDLEAKVIEYKERFDEQMKASNATLVEEKQRNKALEEKLEKSLHSTSLADRKLATVMAKYESIREEHEVAKETMSSLRDRLRTMESTSELAASSAAEKYREAASEMQTKIEALQDCLEEKDTALQVERSARHKAEEEMQYWRETVEDLNAKQSTIGAKDEMYSPCRSESSKRTTSSLVLAKTLKFEVEKNCDVTERIIEAEKIIAVTQSKLRETERELQSSKQEAFDLRSELFSYRRRSNSECFDDSSIASSRYLPSNAQNHLKKKLSCAKSQCEEYKKELDLIIAQIKGIQSEHCVFDAANTKSNPSSATIETVKELVDVCAKVNVVASSRVNELEEKIQFLMNSMYQLHDLCKEEYSFASGNSYNLEMMEEGATPMKGNGAVSGLYEFKEQNDVESPLSCDKHLDSSQSESPNKFVLLRSKLLSVEEQLKSAMIDKLSLADELNETKEKINVLTSSLEESKGFSGRAAQLEEERNLLEKSLLALRCHAEKLEQKIKNLEEHNIFLFDDAVARGNELLGAKHKIEVLENDAAKSLTRLKQLENEKHLIQDNLLISETSIDQLQKEMKVLKSEAEEHVSMIHSLQESLATANEQTKELTQAYMKCNEELALVVETKAQLEASNAEMISKVTKLEAELSLNLHREGTMNAELAQLREKLGSTEDACDSMHEELVAMGSQVDTLHAINDEYERELSQAKKYIQVMETNATSLKQNIESLVRTMQEKDDEMNRVSSSYKMSLEKISELERQISEMANVHENALRAKNDQMEQMTTQLDDVRNKFSEQEASYSQLLSHNETQINMLTTQLADVKERYEAHLEKM